VIFAREPLASLAATAGDVTSDLNFNSNNTYIVFIPFAVKNYTSPGLLT